MTYLLMSEDVTSDLSFFTLDEFDICLHPLFGECSGEFVIDVGVRM